MRPIARIRIDGPAHEVPQLAKLTRLLPSSTRSATIGPLHVVPLPTVTDLAFSPCCVSRNSPATSALFVRMTFLALNLPPTLRSAPLTSSLTSPWPLVSSVPENARDPWTLSHPFATMFPALQSPWTSVNPSTLIVSQVKAPPTE